MDAVPADYAAPADHLAHAVRDWARRQLGVGIGQPNRNLHDDLLAVIEPILLQEVLATVGGRPVLCRQGAVTVCSFHPELGDDLRLHQRFLEGIKA